MTLFKKQYYLIFVKTVPLGHSAQKINVATALYRKKDKDGRQKFFIDHDVRQRHLVNWFMAKWWMLLIETYGRKNKKLFAYKLPNGRVYMKKVKV